jgi:hypothetical protein
MAGHRGRPASDPDSLNFYSGEVTMKISNLTRVAAATSIAGALVVAAIAYASGDKSTDHQPIAASVTDPSTLPAFEHVRVVNATPEQLAALARSTSTSEYVAGQRAYVDAETKRLRPAFPEELAAEAKAASAAAATEAAAPVVTTTETGATGVTLDESYMSYAVARVEPDGSVKQDCVENQPNGEAALKTAAAAPGADSHAK